jgi:hypothetical protein
MLVQTIWPIGAWRKALPHIRATRPDAIMLHADPESLATAGPGIVRGLRAELGAACPVVWFGIAGDVGHTAMARAFAGSVAPSAAQREKLASDILALRMRGVRAAKACGATAVMFDPESAWKRGMCGFDAEAARAFVKAAKAELGPIPFYVTTFDCPGYHSAFPYAAFDECDAWAPQVYAAPSTGDPSPDAPAGRWRLALHRRMWSAAERLGWLKPRPVIAYVQGHHVTVRETCCIADAHEIVCVWATPERFDANGLLACRVLMELERRGFKGPGRVARFQASVGLVADGLVGPRTIAALGLA